MYALPPLNFPACALRISKRAGLQSVWDELRKRWLVLTPEEWVRRHVIRFVENEMGAVALYMAQEVPVELHGQIQRADVVVYGRVGRITGETTGRSGEALMLVECKAPEVAIDKACLAQAVRYNSVIGARYLFLTNGLRHYFYERNQEGKYVPLKEVPDLRSFFK